MSEITDHKELERRSNDRVIIRNPTNQDFPLTYNNLVHTVPSVDKDLGFGPGSLEVSRYLGMHYLKHMTDKIMMDRIDVAVRAENKRREGAGMPRLTHWEERKPFEDAIAKPQDPKQRAEVMKALYGGVVKEFGRGDVSKGEIVEREPVHETASDFMSSIDNSPSTLSDIVEDTEPVESTEAKKLEALKGIAQ